MVLIHMELEFKMKSISLNVPDIIEIHGIFESADLEVPSAPKMTF